MPTRPQSFPMFGQVPQSVRPAEADRTRGDSRVLPFCTHALKARRDHQVARAATWGVECGDSSVVEHLSTHKLKHVLPGTHGQSSQCGRSRVAASLLLFFCLAQIAPAQLTTGIVEGILRDSQHHALANATISIEGRAGLVTSAHTDPDGHFTATLPYGQYKFSGVAVDVAPLETTHIELTATNATTSLETLPGFWLDTTKAQTYPEAFSLAAAIQNREPSSVAAPQNFTGLADTQLSVESQGGISWTQTHYTLQGLDATDSYQPGRPAILPNIADMAAITLRGGLAQSPSASAGTEIGLFMAQPESPWHATLNSSETGSPLAASNLPANSGEVQQSQYFKWQTRDGLEIGGPIHHWADVFASAWGQWADQAVPLQPAPNDQRSRLLFANVRGRIRLTAKDQLDALYLGSRIDLSNWGSPDGIEAYAGNRMMPSFPLPGGIPGQEEVDHLDFIQTGWTHLSDDASRLGTLQVRYGYSTAHLDTDLVGQGPAQQQSRIELTTGIVTGAPPLGNFAIRTRQSVESSWQPRPFTTAFIHHRIAAGGGVEDSTPRNRFSTPSNMNLITANGAPAFLIAFNTPADTTDSIKVLSGYINDQMTLATGVIANVGILAERSTGSVQGVNGNLIGWNSLSPRASLAWTLPHSQGLTLRAAYARLYSPLAGRFLDYGDPNSLSGQEYQWNDANSTAHGALLSRFGGPYSSISPTLRQPYSNRITAGADVALSKFIPHTTAGIQLFRVDTNNRIAAQDVGVPAQDYTPVVINDPGPDGVPGTFDDAKLTVYAQNPATLGQDRYLLTNPSGLNARHLGFTADARTEWHGLHINAAFTAEKSQGATNPGNALYQNDPGVLGALYLDPNTAINASNRTYTDRAYVGKIYGTYRLPWLGIELASTAVYMDGLAFARDLLVTGLPQGPFMVAATVRGSPEGGNRAQHIVNWNAGLRRDFRTRAGLLTAKLDIMNVMNGASATQQNDLTGTSFNLRLPVAIQAPRAVSPGFVLTF